MTNRTKLREVCCVVCGISFMTMYANKACSDSCKKTRRLEYQRKYWDKIKETKNAYRRQDRDRISKREREYRAMPHNKEREAERRRRYNAANREMLLASSKNWRLRNPDQRRGRVDTDKQRAYRRRYYMRIRALAQAALELLSHQSATGDNHANS